MPTRRKATIKLYDGDDLAQLQRLRVALNDAIEAEEHTTASLADTSAEDARIAFNEFLHGEADERATSVVLQALRWDVWDEMEAAHPARTVEEPIEDEDGEDGAEETTELPGVGDVPVAPRKREPRTRTVPHPEDRDFDINTRTLPPVLVPASIVEAPSDFDAGELSKPDYWRLFFAALALNRQGADPKEIAPFAIDPENIDE